MYGYQVKGGVWDKLGNEIDIYTLLGGKWITKENLLYRTGNCTQCSVTTYTGRKSKKEWTY